MALTGVETVIDEVVTYLKANLPARCAAIAAGPPVLTLPAPDNANYFFGDRQLIPGYPAVVVAPRPSEIENDRKDRMDFDHVIAVQVFVTDADEELLTRKLLRYTRAVLEVLVDGRIANAFTFTLDLEEQVMDPSSASGPENDLFERSLVLTVQCWKEEVR